MPVSNNGRKLPVYLFAPVLVLAAGLPTIARADDDDAQLIEMLAPAAGSLDGAPAAAAAQTIAVFRNVTGGLFAATEFNLKTCKLVSVGAISPGVAPKHGKIGSAAGQVTATTGPCKGKTYKAIIATYTWTDASKTGTADSFSVVWKTPDKKHMETVPYEAVLVPILTGPSEVWWFNGEKPAGYDTEITLTAQPVKEPKYTWTVTKGKGLVRLDGKASPITTATNTVKVTGVGASTAKNDVEIEVGIAGNQSTPVKLTVMAPHKLKFLKDVDAVDATFAYQSKVHYEIQDNFGAVLPKMVPLNEKFTTGVINDVKGADWRRGPEGGANVNPADWFDHIQGEIATKTPKPKAPATPLGAVKVDHWDGGWQIGSATIGKGEKVQTNVWQKFEDHARHETIKSPPAAAATSVSDQ